jgi:hypothetical protein
VQNSDVMPAAAGGSPAEVLLMADGVVKQFGTHPITVPAGPVVLVLPRGTRSVRLDGRERKAPEGSPALLPVDLSRSVGFHRLEISSHSYWFATNDSKLTLDGIEELLRYLREYHLGTTWSGQIMFSDGQVLRDPHVVFGWLENRLAPLLEAVKMIALRPLWGTVQQDSLRRRGGPGVTPSATLALLRSSPAQYLEPAENGILAIGKNRYNPLRVVAHRRTASLHSVAHLRLIALMSHLSHLVREVYDYVDDAKARQTCEKWQDQIRKLLASSFCQALRRAGARASSLAVPVSPEEASDRRYRVVYETALSLKRGFGWDATQKPLDRFSYVSYADQIYQAFVGAAIADALECRPTDPVLGRTSRASFGNNTLSMILNRVPPDRLLRSWRHVSTTPDSLRPDVLIEHLPDRRVLLIDAKYRATGNRATESSRAEVMMYMAAFGLSTAVIAYPANSPSARPALVEGAGQRLIELPVVPHADLGKMLREWLPELLQYLEWGSY